MELDLWLAFAAACFVIAIVPGPGVAAILGFAFNSGQRVALAAVAGMAVGNAIAMSLSLAGAGAILASSALAYTILKWLGAAYLVALGLLAIRRSGRMVDRASPRPPVGARTAFLSTVAVGTFHPKTILFFVAFAAQFIRPEEAFLPQAVLLVATFTGIAAATDTAYAVLGSRGAALLNSSFRAWGARAGGGVLIAAGIATAAMRRGG